MVGNSGLRHIGLTAHATSYVWYKLGVPEADRFVTRKGRLVYGALAPFIAVTRLAGKPEPVGDLLVPRHRIFEHQLRESGCRTFIELGAGLSPRGTAYTRDPQVTFVEVDLPQMVSAKRALLGSNLGPNHSILPGDVRDESLFGALAELVGEAAPVAVVAEGLSAYLTIEEIEAVLANIAGLLSRTGGGLFLMDVNPAAAIDAVGGLSARFKPAIDRIAGGRIQPPFRHAEDAVRLFKTTGFSRVNVHDPATHPAGSDSRSGWMVVLEGWVDHVVADV
jgi:O-methyltransferase involved in polyketide biosynthesis